MAMNSDRVKFNYVDFEKWFLRILMLIFVVGGMVLFTSKHARAQEISSNVQDVSATAADLGGNEAKEASSETDADEVLTSNFKDRLDLNYFMILFGPSVGNPSGYQATTLGRKDSNRPVLLKNFLTLGYNATDEIQVSGSAAWTYVPVMGQDLILKDPYFRIAHNSLISTDQFNLYSDLRFIMPVTNESRYNDMLAGFQQVNVAWYQIGTSRFAAALYTSVKYFVYGGLGNGDDFEGYLGPNINYQLSPKVSLTLLYEMGASHRFGQESFHFNNDGTDLEPGVSWDITPQLNINPYFTIYTGAKVSLNTTSIGMTLNWNML